MFRVTRAVGVCVGVNAKWRGCKRASVEINLATFEGGERPGGDETQFE